MEAEAVRDKHISIAVSCGCRDVLDREFTKPPINVRKERIQQHKVRWRGSSVKFLSCTEQRKRKEGLARKEGRKKQQFTAWRSTLMPPRTKSPLSSPHSGEGSSRDAHDTAGGSPRRSARFALAPSALPVASTSRVHASGTNTSTPASTSAIRVLRPASARRLSAKAQAQGGHEADSRETKKRKSPDLQEEGVRKRLRVRCPAEPHPTPTRKGKGKAPSPPSSTSIRNSPNPNGHTTAHTSHPNDNSHSHTQNGAGIKITATATSTTTPAASRTTRVTRRTARQMQMQGSFGSPKSPSTSSSTNANPKSSPTANASTSANTNPMTLRSTTPTPTQPRHVRGSSPAPGRLDEIDMGVSVGSAQFDSKQGQGATSPKLSMRTGVGMGMGMESPLSSPLTSPVRERGEGSGAPWEQVRVKREPEEVRIGMDVDVRVSAQAEGVREKDGKEKEGDVEMPLAQSGQREKQGEGEAMEEDVAEPSVSAATPAAAANASGSNQSPSPTSPTLTPIATTPATGANVNPSPTTNTSPSTNANLSTTGPTSPTSPCPSPSTPGSARALSPEDLAPSPFAPPVLPVCVSAGELSALAPVPPACAALANPSAGLGVGDDMSALGADGRPAATDPIALALALDSVGILPGPPVSPDWPLPHAPFPLSSSSPSASQPESVSDTIGVNTFSAYPSPASPTSPTMPTGTYGAPAVFGMPPPPFGPPTLAAPPLGATGSGGTFASHAERQTRAVEWSALLERRRRAGERAMADAREAEERRRAMERWSQEWGVPFGRGAPVCWVADGAREKGKEAQESKGEKEGKDGDGDVQMDGRRAPAHVQAEDDTEGDGEDGAGGYAPEDAYAEDDYGRMRKRSPLCIVSIPPSPIPPPSPLVLDPQSPSPSVDGAMGGPQQNEGQQQNLEEGEGGRTDLVYEAPQVLYPPQQQQGENEDLGPDPATRMNTGWGPWKIACRMRVWDVRQRYTPGLIRSLVAQEADDYFSARGLPHPDALLFMDEEYYDWELEESASEGDGSGEDEGESSFELEQQAVALQSFALDPAPNNNPDANCDSENNCDDKERDAEGEIDLGTGMGGVLSSFYVAPPPPPSAQQQALQQHLQAQGHAHGHVGFPPQMQLPLPLPLPPPPLASVRVPVLRHFFTDIPIAPAAGAARGRGTPVDLSRKAAWGGGAAEEVESMGAGRGTLERRLPHPRPRPHPMYLAMARAAEGEAYGDGAEERIIAEEDLPPLPRLREPGESPMLPMRGLRDLVRSLRGEEEEDEGTEEERTERERREMSEAFEPDEAVWQEFLKSVGVDGAAASTSADQNDENAMEVDSGRNTMDADADADADADEDTEESGGSGGTSGGVSLGLPPPNSSSTPSSSGPGSVLSAGVGMGVEMGIGMFGMAMGAMGMGWFGGPTSPPVTVAVGDVGERERERESSLSFALGSEAVPRLLARPPPASIVKNAPEVLGLGRQALALDPILPDPRNRAILA
ncbi:hypothetical protein B0H19DRAFT_1244102 [Mycena capillaripes]|nr:hypothetical protein B0H19DRAFT_1244102 [Mycena capillaripes]